MSHYFENDLNLKSEIREISYNLDVNYVGNSYYSFNSWSKEQVKVELNNWTFGCVFYWSRIRELENFLAFAKQKIFYLFSSIHKTAYCILRKILQFSNSW